MYFRFREYSISFYVFIRVTELCRIKIPTLEKAISINVKHLDDTKHCILIFFFLNDT